MIMAITAFLGKKIKVKKRVFDKYCDIFTNKVYNCIDKFYIRNSKGLRTNYSFCVFLWRQNIIYCNIFLIKKRNLLEYRYVLVVPLYMVKLKEEKIWKKNYWRNNKIQKFKLILLNPIKISFILII
jgi:hypothetical protein